MKSLAEMESGWITLQTVVRMGFQLNYWVLQTKVFNDIQWPSNNAAIWYIVWVSCVPGSFLVMSFFDESFGHLKVKTDHSQGLLNTGTC